MNGTDTFLDINNAHLRVNSGNVQASTFVLDQINIVTSANTATTVNFNNVTKAFNAVSNIEVGTANLFVDTTTSKVGIGTDAPEYALDVHGSANVGALTATTFSGSGAGLTALNATNIASGTLDAARVPDLDAAKITTGTLDAARVPDLDAAKITTGTLDAARVPTPTTFTTATFTGDVTVNTDTFHVDTTNDRVGVGTTTPVRPVHILTSTGTNSFIRVESNEADEVGTEFFKTGTTHPWYNYSGANRTDLRWYRGGIDRMRLSDEGDLSIDTMNPYSMLHLGSDTAPSGGRANSGNMTASDYYLLLGRAEHGVAKEWRIGFGYNTSATNVPPSYIGYHERVNSSGTKGDLVFGGRHTDNAGIQATERMRITYDGCVGIRNTTPDCPLHVSGYGGTNTGATYHSGFVHGQESLHRWTNNHSNVGIFADDDIMSHGYILSINGTFGASDRRIKKDIVDIDDGAALQILRQLQPKQYKYIDTYRKTSDPVWGFIAQEVRETLPHSTQFRTEFIPDITEVATVSESTVLTFTNFDTSNLEIGKKLRVHDQNHAEHKIKVAAIIDAHSVRVEEDLSGWTCSFNEDGTIGEGNSLYVFGREVDDFVFIKKDAIWTVATAALQEVDRQLQAEKEKVTTLETQLASVLTRLDALENA
jgi:hypothetical protein